MLRCNAASAPTRSRPPPTSMSHFQFVATGFMPNEGIAL
jgi:hypothetical protein